MNVNSLCKLGIAQLRRQIRAAANMGFGVIGAGLLWKKQINF